MLPKKLIALTHCLKSSLLRKDFVEAEQLLKQREAMIQELGISVSKLSSSERAALLEADTELQAAAAQQKAAVVERLRQFGATKRLRKTYRVS